MFQVEKVRVLSVEFGEVHSARVQHVWVDTTGRFVDPSPGLLLMWRQRTGKRPGWDAFVVVVDQGDAGDASARWAWIDARLVRACVSERPKPDLSRYRPVNDAERAAALERDR